MAKMEEEARREEAERIEASGGGGGEGEEAKAAAEDWAVGPGSAKKGGEAEAKQGPGGMNVVVALVL